MVHLSGKTPVRIFFHVEYKPISASGDVSRQIKKDEVGTLDEQLRVMAEKIREISSEIDHARKQETVMKEAGGE